MTLMAQSRSWPEIVKFYRELVVDYGWNFAPMVGLVEFITSTPYSTGLFPTTSVARLCIARTRTIRWSNAMLMVEYSLTDERFIFEYFDASLLPRPWVTSCPATEGQARFERLMLKRLRWFKESPWHATSDLTP